VLFYARRLGCTMCVLHCCPGINYLCLGICCLGAVPAFFRYTAAHAFAITLSWLPLALNSSTAQAFCLHAARLHCDTSVLPSAVQQHLFLRFPGCLLCLMSLCTNSLFHSLCHYQKVGLHIRSHNKHVQTGITTGKLYFR